MKTSQNTTPVKPGTLCHIISETAPLLFLVVLIAVMYGYALRNFWLYDDPQILKHAISYHPWEYFFIPKVWQEFSVNNFTPWVILSFDIDWTIFGLSPYGFYLHQLVSLCLLSGLSYAVLSLWYSRWLSLFGILLFAVSSSFAESAQLLMVRHYIEGAIFALLCIYFFVMAVRNDNLKLSLVSAFFYLLSCSAKEIYIPLIWLLLLLPEKRLYDRFRIFLPSLGIMVFYVLWRWIMLGSLLGDHSVESLGMHEAKVFFLGIADAMGNGMNSKLITHWRWLIGGSSLLSLTLLLTFDRKGFLRVLLVAPLVLLPIFPVISIMMPPRYVWLFSFCWAVLHINAWHVLRQSIDRLSIHIFIILWWAILVSAFLYASLSSLGQMKGFINSQSNEGIFVLKQGTEADLLVDPGSPGHYYAGLSWLRKEVLRLPKGPSVSGDARIICFENQFDQDYKTVWHFDMQKGSLFSEPYHQYKEKFCSKEIIKSIRLDAPLSLELYYNDSTAVWLFGPYKGGSYALLAGKTAEGVFPLPFMGKRFVHFNDSVIPMRLRYSSPEGWTTYSPLLDLDVKNGCSTVKWKR